MAPGAWELPRPGVLVGILTRETVPIEWALAFRRLQLPPNSDVTVRSGKPFDVARNEICEETLQRGFEYVFMLDDDVVAPADTVPRLIAHGRDIISGLYRRRNVPIVPVAMAIDKDGQAQWVTVWNPPGSVVEVDLVGAGCLLIHRRVLERMKHAVASDPALRGRPPWFEWLRENQGPRKFSEDFAFCWRARSEFFKTYLDTSIVCAHIGKGKSSDEDGKFEPSHP